MKKRNLTSYLLCALALATCLLLAACGKPDPEAANYEVEKGVITKYIGTATDVTIPAKISGKTITTIGERAFYGNKTVKSVTLSDGIKEIGKEAFCYSQVETVNLGTVEKIDEAAFRFAPLMNLTLPGTVKELGYRCFASLTHTENTNGDLYISASVTNIPEEAFIFTRFQNIEFESATMPTMAANSFENAGVVNIILPDSVVADDILDYTDTFVAAGMYESNVSFSNTKGEPLVFEYEDFSDRFRYRLDDGGWLIEYLGNDETVVLPNSIEGCDMTVVFDGLFMGNSTVKKIVIPEGFVTLNSDAFRECTNLETVIIPEGVESLGDGVFADCTALKHIELPESVTSIGVGAFNGCTALESVTLSPNMTEIPDSAFAYCSSLQSITLPDSIKTIGNFAFSSTGFATIDLNNVETLGQHAFSNAKLTEITVPGTVKVIPEQCFIGCTQLTDITLEKGVERIETYAFFNCGRDDSKKIAHRYIKTLDPAADPTILPNQEDYQPFINIHLPGTIKYIGNRFVNNCCVEGLYMLDVKSVDDLPEFDPEAFVGLYAFGQIYFEKEVIDEHMDELDAFFMAMENMSDKSYYDDGSRYYWISE